LNPTFALAQARFYITRAYLVEKRGLPAVEMALALDANSAEGHELRGEAAYLLGRYDDAINDLERALALEPARASGHLRLGMALLARGEVEAAEWEFNRAIDLDPGGESGARARSYVK
jgi:Flp pilus assembly protein TadD